mgnify:CR=1 FL=1
MFFILFNQEDRRLTFSFLLHILKVLTYQTFKALRKNYEGGLK